MRFPVFLLSGAARKGRRGMALVLTLAILVILTVVLVAFVSTSALDRGASKSYGQSLRADQIALGGLDQIVTQFQSEIADPNLSTNYPAATGTNNLYIPLSGSNAFPQRTAPYLANLATLLTYSGTNLYTVGSGAPNLSSTSSTLTKSLDGRYISTARWNKPQLTTGTSGFPTPQWILMTRAGPQAMTSYNSALANSTPSNTSYVVGRYAYVVYDTSGLLDANVAGYPSSSGSNASGKGLMPWADLTQLTGTGGISLTGSDVNNMVNWRNAATVASYPSNVYTSATNNGFTRVANGDTCFLSRQDLIQWTQQPGNTDWQAVLPYLTTFSRELNGPTWGPSTPVGSTINYAGQQYTAGVLNPRIPNPRVSGTFTRDNGLPAVVGEPLVKYRFPLDKLALLEKFTGTGTGTLTPADILNIQKYFGMDLASDANGPSYRHWKYPTTNPKYVHGVLSGTTGIMTLDDVAKQNREPDFFELLQAGILAGSLGDPGTNSTTGYPNPGRFDKYPVAGGNGPQPPNYIDPDDSTTLQIMRIGVNIIDQWGAENFPTTITYTPSSGSTYYNVEGIKDLPYPFAAYLNVYAATSGTTGYSNIPTALPPFNLYLYFGLWNPHQAPSSSVANYPTNFRFFPYYLSTLTGNSDSFVAGFDNAYCPVITNGVTTWPKVANSWFYNGTATTANGANGTHTPYYLNALFPSGLPFSYSPVLTATNNYRQPALAVGAPVLASGAQTTAIAPPAPWNGIACMVLPPLTSFPNTGKKANNDGSAGFPANVSGTGGPNSAWRCQYDLKMVMPVQYQDAANNWHTYGTFLGIDDPGGAYVGGETCYDSNFGDTAVSGTASLSCTVLVKSDPRTFRFGVGSGGSSPDVNVPLATGTGMVIPVTNAPFGSLSPFGSASVSGSTPYRLDMWAANDSTIIPAGPSSASPNPYYSDNDGAQRWGDARNSYKSSTPSSPLFATGTANRPIVLNRPFQSVGEIGYAFRDSPWKTLDLFSTNSADSALLDLFTLSDAPVAAGRVNPNTPYPQVLAALISGETQSTSGVTFVSSTSALAVGQAIQLTTGTAPFVNRADLGNRLMSSSAIAGAIGAMAPSGIKTEEEAVVRGVAESANTRTWNLMIDIIAQSGRYPTSAGTLDNFVVEGERRYWLHVAIDRYTGQVVDKQLEVVNE